MPWDRFDSPPNSSVFVQDTILDRYGLSFAKGPEVLFFELLFFCLFAFVCFLEGIRRRCARRIIMYYIEITYILENRGGANFFNISKKYYIFLSYTRIMQAFCISWYTILYCIFILFSKNRQFRCFYNSRKHPIFQADSGQAVQRAGICPVMVESRRRKTGSRRLFAAFMPYSCLPGAWPATLLLFVTLDIASLCDYGTFFTRGISWTAFPENNIKQA